MQSTRTTINFEKGLTRKHICTNDLQEIALKLINELYSRADGDYAHKMASTHYSELATEQDKQRRDELADIYNRLQNLSKGASPWQHNEV